MSSDPLLNKMDALLKKHRGDGEASPSEPTDGPPPLPDDAWLPVLTDVVAVEETSQIPEPPVASVPATPPAPSAPMIDPDELAEKIMAELEPQLGAMVREQFVSEIRDSLSSTLSTLFRRMDVQIRETVRAAIADHLGKR